MTIAKHFRLKTPCANCPFRREGAIELAPGRLDGIMQGLLANDQDTFHCHKTVHSSRGGVWNEHGDYQPSGHEAQCAGAAAFLLKAGRPSVLMRLAMMAGAIRPGHWDEAEPLVVEPKR
jgi:hypothetical protein